MSTQTQTSQTNQSEKAQQLTQFLRDEVSEASGELYVKGKFIAEDVNLTPKEIGQLMIQLQETVADLEIEKWSYTGATTWRITTS